MTKKDDSTATKRPTVAKETSKTATKRPTAKKYETLFAIQDIDVQIIEYLTRHPEHIEFTIINKVYEKLGIPDRTFRHHVEKLKKYGILKAALYLTEDTKELIDLVKRIGEGKEDSP